MTPYRIDCPHCGTRNVSCENRGRCVQQDGQGYELYTLLQCQFCQRGSLAVFNLPNPNQVPTTRYLKAIHPRFEQPPPYLPEPIERRYSEAIGIMGTAFESAGMMFRKTLEVAFKTIRSDDKGNLKSRIDKAAEAGAITEDLAQWAHRIRLDGNEAAHDESFSSDDVRALKRFTELVLLYLFTLPGMLAASKKG